MESTLDFGSSLKNAYGLASALKAKLETDYLVDSEPLPIHREIVTICSLLKPFIDYGGNRMGRIPYASSLMAVEESLLKVRERLRLCDSLVHHPGNFLGKQGFKSSANSSDMDGVLKIFFDDRFYLAATISHLPTFEGHAPGHDKTGTRFRDKSVESFWGEYLGEKVHTLFYTYFTGGVSDIIVFKIMWIPTSSFRHALSSYLGEALPTESFNNLISLLDQYYLGGVSSSNLDLLVGRSGDLDSFLASFFDSQESDDESGALASEVYLY